MPTGSLPSGSSGMGEACKLLYKLMDKGRIYNWCDLTRAVKPEFCHSELQNAKLELYDPF